MALRYNASGYVLQHVNLALEAPSFHFLTGPSGAGKTSLLKMLYLHTTPSEGEIELLGHNTKNLSRQQKAQMRRRIGIVFQDYRLLKHLSSFENVALPLRVQNISEDEIRHIVRDIIQWVGLKHKINHTPQNMSGGECQRLAVARAVICKPDILLADEPTGNVDDLGALRLVHLFEEMYARGTSIIFATHNYKMVKNYNHPVLHISDDSLSRFASAQFIDDKQFNIFN